MLNKAKDKLHMDVSHIKSGALDGMHHNNKHCKWNARSTMGPAMSRIKG